MIGTRVCAENETREKADVALGKITITLVTCADMCIYTFSRGSWEERELFRARKGRDKVASIRDLCENEKSLDLNVVYTLFASGGEKFLAAGYYARGKWKVGESSVLFRCRYDGYI